MKRNQEQAYALRHGHKIRVRVMARAEGYAMVRRKGFMPFIISEKDLKEAI